jgi:hypothetical protein
MGLGAPELILIMCVFGFFLIFPIWGYKEGSKRTVGSTGGLLLGLFLGIIGILIIYGSRSIEESSYPSFQAHSKADELQKYKQLLDSGAITEAEYESQKAKLLS